MMTIPPFLSDRPEFHKSHKEQTLYYIYRGWNILTGVLPLYDGCLEYYLRTVGYDPQTGGKGYGTRICLNTNHSFF